MIDAHQHFLPVFHPGVLEPELARAGVTSTVLVQSADTPEENDRLLAYAAEVPYVAGVVAWLPLSDPSAASAGLARLPTPPVAGVRCLIGREPADWLVSDATLGVLAAVAARGLAWDVVPVTARQVDHVCRIAAAVPDLRIVVDHLARPPVEAGRAVPGGAGGAAGGHGHSAGPANAGSEGAESGSRERWTAWIARLAEHPNVAMKVSVGIDALTAWREWDPDSLLPHVREAVSCFGADRLMLASNWPVILLRRPYAAALSDLEGALERSGLDDDGLAAARGTTATHWYRLQS